MLSRAVRNEEIQGPFAQRHFGRLNNRDDLESFADQLVNSTGAKSRPFGQRTAIIEAITGAAKYLGDDPAFDIVASLREFLREGLGRKPGDLVLVNKMDVFQAATDSDRKEAYVAALRSLIEARRVMCKETEWGAAISLNSQLNEPGHR